MAEDGSVIEVRQTIDHRRQPAGHGNGAGRCMYEWIGPHRLGSRSIPDGDYDVTGSSVSQLAPGEAGGHRRVGVDAGQRPAELHHINLHLLGMESLPVAFAHDLGIVPPGRNKDARRKPE